MLLIMVDIHMLCARLAPLLAPHNERMSMESVLSYVHENKDRFIDELKEFLRFKSISADPQYKPEVARCAEWLAAHLRSIGLEHVELLETPSNPVVYADWLHAEGKPTIMIYGHYDVQPPDPVDQWKSDPFECVIRDGAMYARGTADDKGQVWVHIKVLEAYLKTNKTLPVNIKLFIEGDEESGGDMLHGFVKSHAEMLDCNAILISDSSWYNDELPGIITSLRGLSYMEFKVKGPGIDLHSGQFGGVAINPLNVAGHIISKLRDENGTIQIPGFYDDLVELSAEEKKALNSLPFDDAAKCREMQISHLWGEKEFTPAERLGIRPTLDVHGFIGGYTAPGAKTVIPSECTVKVSMRLVAHQDPFKIAKLFENYVKSLVPPGASVEVKLLNAANPVFFPMDNPYVQAAGKAIEAVTGKPAVYMKEGASIPVTDLFQKELKVPSVLAGFGLATDAIHSPNEHFRLKNFYIGLDMAARMLDELGRVSS